MLTNEKGNTMYIKTALFGLALLLFAGESVHSATVPVGSGSYTTTFPGVDEAARNGYPGGTPQLSGNAVGRPVPSNDWWSRLLKDDHVNSLFNYPMAMGTLASGLDIGLVVPASGANGSLAPRDPFDTVVVGVSGLAAAKATIDDHRLGLGRAFVSCDLGHRHALFLFLQGRHLHRFRDGQRRHGVH